LGIVAEMPRIIESPSPAAHPVARPLAFFLGAVPLVPGVVDLRQERFPAILAVTSLHGTPPYGGILCQINRNDEFVGIEDS
jgi:hypothetical protein